MMWRDHCSGSAALRPAAAVQKHGPPEFAITLGES